MSLKKLGQGSLNAEEKWFGFACILNLLRKIKLTEPERSAIYAALEKLNL
jgi:hypothetical protein